MAVPEGPPIRFTVMRALVDVAATVYDEDDSATSVAPLLEVFATEVMPEDDVAPVAVATLDAELSFAPLQAARAAISVQSAARLRVLKCMLMFLLGRRVM